MIAEWIIGNDGRLKRPLVILYSSLIGIPEARLKTLVFHFNARQKNKAETWGVNRIKLNPDAYANTDDPAWLGTIAHEITHEYDYYQSSFPDFLIRFWDRAGIKFREYILGMPHENAYQASPMEKKAFANQKIIMDFVNRYAPQKILMDAAISESDKIKFLMAMVEEFKKERR